MKQRRDDQESEVSPDSWVIESGSKGIRLDAFLRTRFPHLSLRELRRAVDDGAFLIDDHRAKKGQRLFPGEVVALGDSRLLAPAPAPQDLEVPVLYEDEAILALDKPAGLATHGFSGRFTETLANFLSARYPSLMSVGKNRWEPGLVHRLDKNTSGVVLVAKNQEAYDDLRAQFRAGEIQKCYWALGWGRVRKQGAVELPLAHNPKDKRKMSAVEERHSRYKKIWPALTRYRRLNFNSGMSFVEVQMNSGVTHQIRVHLAAVGHPLVADDLYGAGKKSPFRLKRHFLHAIKVVFTHPGTRRRMTIVSPLPVDLRQTLEELKMEY